MLLLSPATPTLRVSPLRMDLLLSEVNKEFHPTFSISSGLATDGKCLLICLWTLCRNTCVKIVLRYHYVYIYLMHFDVSQKILQTTHTHISAWLITHSTSFTVSRIMVAYYNSTESEKYMTWKSVKVQSVDSELLQPENTRCDQNGKSAITCTRKTNLSKNTLQIHTHTHAHTYIYI